VSEEISGADLCLSESVGVSESVCVLKIPVGVSEETGL
jgi:hypothetical protein